MNFCKFCGKEIRLCEYKNDKEVGCQYTGWVHTETTYHYCDVENPKNHGMAVPASAFVREISELQERVERAILHSGFVAGELIRPIAREIAETLEAK